MERQTLLRLVEKEKKEKKKNEKKEKNLCLEYVKLFLSGKEDPG